MHKVPSTLLCLCGVFGLSAASCSGGTSTPGDAEFVFDTGTYSVDPGAEKYMCFTKTVAEDTWVDRFTHGNEATVHHMVLVHTLAPEPAAPFECPTFFKTTWIPLFATGTADAELAVPKGSSFFLPKGTQLLMQLHLLNASDRPTKGSLSVNMRKVAKTASEAGIYGFGTTIDNVVAG